MFIDRLENYTHIIKHIKFIAIEHQCSQKLQPVKRGFKKLYNIDTIQLDKKGKKGEVKNIG